MKKFAVIFCLLIFIVQFIQIIYFQRGTFLEKYDAEYWKDRYEHSQYQLPLSKRIIGDDGLFAYSGYRLILGDNPFSINNDKPPVAKYLFGLSTLIFYNPLYVVLFFGFCTLIIFYFIAKRFFKNNSLALLVTTLLFLDPLFFSQLWITGFDLIQLFFLLLNLLLLLNIKKLWRWNIFVILGSGLSLGLFTEVKPPILLPIIFILETAFLLYKGLRKEYLLFIFGLFLGIMIPYIRFIYLGNGIIDVLKVHKFMASIYLQSQLKVHLGAIWQTLLMGQFPNLVTKSLTAVSEWWIAWPVLTLAGVPMALFSLFSKKFPVFNKGLGIFILASLTIFTFIPSYPRYLVIILPFMYFFGISFFQRFLNRGRPFLYIILLVFGVINSFFFLLPKPENFLNVFYYSLSHLYFQDIYQENISDTKSLELTRDRFRYIANKALENAGVKSIEVKELSKSVSLFSESGKLKIGLTYKTQDLGSFYEEKNIKLVKINNKWKIKWDWDIIFNDFLPEYKIESNIVLGKRGSIIRNAGSILVWDAPSILVLFNPNLINSKKEQEMLNYIQSFDYKKDVFIQNAYLENVLSGEYVPLLVFHRIISDKEKVRLLSYPGIEIMEYPSRIYDGGIDFKSLQNTLFDECCTRIYSSYSYHGIRDIEKEYDNVLWGYSGGRILMKDAKGSIIRVILEKNKKDGQDVIL